MEFLILSFISLSLLPLLEGDYAFVNKDETNFKKIKSLILI